MIRRLAATKLQNLCKGFPIVAITGPRQSGKTTLARASFPDYEYFSLEDLDSRQEAADDPRGFLQRRANGFILDEVQHVPELFPYLQTYADSQKSMGRIVLTGSQNFLMMQRITESLAGRVGMIELLPFSWEELPASKKNRPLDQVLFTGAYPPVHEREIDPLDWYPRYIQTYIDRDVRSLRNIGNLQLFQRFVRLCAGRVGQLLNFNALATEAGVDHKTAQAWLSVLEAAYIVFRLQPYHQNFNKRLVKQPKLYFTDSGLLCSLLQIESPAQLETHYARGALFENWVVAECLKQRFNLGRTSNLFFFRDHSGREVDLLQEEGDTLHATEIKSGATLNSSFFDNLKWFAKLESTSVKVASLKLIYGGDRNTHRDAIEVKSWRSSPVSG